jgi:hypothetical protein
MVGVRKSLITNDIVFGAAAYGTAIHANILIGGIPKQGKSNAAWRTLLASTAGLDASTCEAGGR